MKMSEERPYLETNFKDLLEQVTAADLQEKALDLLECMMNCQISGAPMLQA